MPTHIYTTVDPLSVANDLITLGHKAIDEGRDPAPYFDHAEAITNAAERGDAASEVAAAVEMISA